MHSAKYKSIRRVFTTACLCATAVSAQAARPLLNLVWLREYAVPYTATGASPVQAKARRQIIWAPQFVPTLRSAFPQQQWFLRDHGRFLSLPEAAQMFLATPAMQPWNTGADAWIDDARYVTEQGCMRGVCGSNGSNGLLWADTSARRPWLVFAAMQLAATSKGPSTHLWLFTSRALKFQRVPPALLTSLSRWMQTDNVTKPSEILLVTVVQPTGEQIDLDLASLKAAKDKDTNR